MVDVVGPICEVSVVVLGFGIVVVAVFVIFEDIVIMTGVGTRDFVGDVPASDVVIVVKGAVDNVAIFKSSF